MIASLLTLPPLLVYLVLFALVAGESAGLPLPGETSLITAAALAAQNSQVSLLAVVVIAAAAAVSGDNVGFALGRRGGRWLLTRDGRFDDTRRRYLLRGERFFERHGSKAVFLARWLPGLRIVGAWLAGTHGMRWRSFLVWNALGGITWAASVGIGAYVLGQAAGGLFRAFGIAGVVLVIAAAASLGAWHLVRRRRGRSVAPGGLLPPRRAEEGDGDDTRHDQRQQPPRIGAETGERRGECDRPPDADSHPDIVADDEIDDPCDDPSHAAGFGSGRRHRSSATTNASAHAAVAAISPSNAESPPGQSTPAPSPAQKIPNAVSITPTANAS